MKVMKMNAWHWTLLLITLVFFVLMGRAYSYINEATRHKVETTQFVTDEIVNSATFNSPTQLIDLSLGFAVQIDVTGCVLCSGLIQMLSSVDGATFIPIAGCDVAITDNGTIILNVPSLYFPFIQLQYTEDEASNTTINAFLSVKEDIGGG